MNTEDKLLMFARYLNGEPIEINEIQEKMLERLVFANKVNDGTEIRRQAVCEKIMNKFKCGLRGAYLILEQSEKLFGNLEYPGLRTEQVFAIRILEKNYEELRAKWVLNHQTWYMDKMDRILDKIHKIKGTYIPTKIEPGPTRKRPQILIASPDPKHIKRTGDESAE